MLVRHLLSTLSVLFVVVSASHAQIVQYTAPGGSFDATTVAANTSAGPLNETGSLGDLQAGATFPNTVFLQQNITSPDAASAVLNNQYFQFSVTPDAGFKFNFTGLTFDAARGGASTPRGWVLRSSLDGFGADIDSDVVPTALPNPTSYSVAFAGAMFNDVLTETIFRFYGFAPSTGVGMFYDNITLNGSVLPANALVKYSAPGGSFAPTEVTGNITASNLSDVGSSGDLQAGATFPNTVFLQQNITSPDAASAVLNNQYFEFTVAADAGFVMDLTSLTFDAARGGASTPRGWLLRSNLDGFTTDIASAVVPTAHAESHQLRRRSVRCLASEHRCRDLPALRLWPQHGHRAVLRQHRRERQRPRRPRTHHPSRPGPRHANAASPPLAFGEPITLEQSTPPSPPRPGTPGRGQGEGPRSSFPSRRESSFLSDPSPLPPPLSSIHTGNNTFTGGVPT